VVERLTPRLELGDFALREFLQLGILEHRLRRFEIFPGVVVGVQRGRQRLELRELARQIAEARVVVEDFGLGEQQGDFLVTLGKLVELASYRGVHSNEF